jgi:hypothetical protein
MNEVFKKRQLSFLLKLGLITVLVAGSHLYLFENFFSDSLLFFPLWQIYAFHVVTVLLIYTVINYKFSNGNSVIFNYFMIGTLLKMVLAFLFLLPLLLSDFQSKKPDVMNFFIPYFIFLAFEVYSVNFFLNKTQ